MRREKIFILIIAVLVIANITTLTFLLCKDGRGDHPHRSDRMKNYLKKEVGFSEAQLASFDSLYVIHQQQNEEKMKGSRQEMETHLKNLSASGFSDSAINVSVEQMSADRKGGVKSMFQHLREIRKLCKPDQLATFDSTIHKIFKRNKFKNKN